MEYQRLLLKISREPVYLVYIPMNIAIRCVPDPWVTIYGRIKGGKEHLIPYSYDLLKTAIQDCKEISKEEYETF